MDHKVLTRLRTFATSRRHFLKSTAVASGLAAATALDPSTIAGVALAAGAEQAGGDLGILNYALTLEHLENRMYRTLIASGLLKGAALRAAQQYGAHESTHVATLTKVITSLGGTPVKEQARYSFPTLTTQAQAINLIQTVEDVGASAYLGAAPLIKNPDLLTAAVTIHTNEAMHATGWRFITGSDPVPFAFAPPRTMAEILKIVTPFLTVS